MRLGRKQRQFGVIATIQRQLRSLLGIDHVPVLAGIGLEQRSVRAHLHGFGYLLHLQGQVHALPGIHAQANLSRFDL